MKRLTIKSILKNFTCVYTAKCDGGYFIYWTDKDGNNFHKRITKKAYWDNFQLASN